MTLCQYSLRQSSKALSRAKGNPVLPFHDHVSLSRKASDPTVENWGGSSSVGEEFTSPRSEVSLSLSP